jgi:two-component system response regulator RegA
LTFHLGVVNFAGGPGMGGMAVLLVDDDEPWVRACERGFRSMGCSVRAAASVAGALATARECPPDLVVAEVRLGPESGVDLIEPLRQAHPGCTIALVSAYLSVALTAVAVRKGAHLVLFKPVHPSEIVRQLPQLGLGEPACVTPTLARAEWEHIQRVLLDCNGNVSEAARRLGILRQSLQRRLRKHAPPE